MTDIHPTATVDKRAELGDGLKIGAHAHIGAGVTLGDDCEVRNGATIVGDTSVGKGCVFFSHCVVGEIPQDLKYKGEPTQTVIGEDNHFREFVTVHAGTAVGGGATRIGCHNRFLVGVHLAHDTTVGSHVVLSNSTLIAGHCLLEDCVTMGGLCAVHHFVSVGRYAMIGGFSRVPSDVLPYMITVGYPAEVRGANFHGLRRWGMTEGDIKAIAGAYKMLYARRRDHNTPFLERLERLHSDNGHNEHVRYLYDFIKRSLSAGNTGRFRELLRSDTAEDSREFFSKKDRED